MKSRTTIVLGFVAIVIIVVASVSYLYLLTPRNRPLEKVTFMLSWKAEGQYAPYFVALDKGWYRDSGLDVTIQPGTGGTFAVQMVGSGKADMGIAPAASIIVGRTQGIPIKSVALIYSRNPVAFFWRDPAITGPQDWVGKRMGFQPSSTTSMVYQVLLKKLGIDRSKIIEVPETIEDPLPLLTTNKTDIVMEYSTRLPMWNAMGYTGIKMVKAEDYGITFYAQAMTSSESFMRDHPETVRKFVEASLKAWTYSRDHPEEAIDILLKYYPNLQKPTDLAMLKSVVTDFISWQNPNVGYSKMDGWQSTHDLLLQYDFLKKKIDNIQEVYTEDFLPK